MDYAIIAAGEGSRLAQEGVKWPKPLVRLNGVALIDRLIDVFLKNKRYLYQYHRKRGDDRGTGLPEGPATTYTLLPVGKIHPQLYAQLLRAESLSGR